jgi:putative transcription antitermination factor YqgF
MDGSVGYAAQRVARYAERMVAALAEMGLQVDLVLWDERLTTVEAEQALRTAGSKQTDVDAAAAAVILQSYLDQQR